MENANQEVPVKPVDPGFDVRLLRCKLILEEALETIAALGFSVRLDLEHFNGDNVDDVTGLIDFDEVNTLVCNDTITFDPACLEFDMEQAVDGCCDISVVTIGTMIALGVPDEPFLLEVDKANLRKFEKPACPECGSSMIINSASTAPDGQHICTQVTCSGTAQGPYRRADGKWIKPVDWTPPNHAAILESLGWEE
jgi:predicted HAD superfamily Cof-like phosphohydrolase